MHISFTNSYNLIPQLPLKEILGITLLSTAVPTITQMATDIFSSIKKIKNKMPIGFHEIQSPFLKAKVLTIDNTSTVEIKSHLELLNDIESLAASTMKSCLSLYSGEYPQEDVDFHCSNKIQRYKNVLNGQCAIPSRKVPLVLSVISNEDISAEQHEDRIRIIPIKFMNAGCQITMKYAKNPLEICHFLDMAKVQFGRPVDH